MPTNEQRTGTLDARLAPEARGRTSSHVNGFVVFRYLGRQNPWRSCHSHNGLILHKDSFVIKLQVSSGAR